MKIDRLVAIMNYLLRHGKTSAQRLAEEFEVSPRTIARDMESLGQAGIPIQSAFGADGGYSIVDTCVIDKKIMNREDYNHIIKGLYALLSVYADKGVVQTMDKVGSLYGNKDCPVQLDFSVANEKHEINERVRILENAIREQRKVSFWYTNNENETRQLQVEPVRLEFKWYNWYLTAYYSKHQDYCMFKLVRMEGVVVLDEKNAVDHTLQEIVIQDRRDVITVRLRGNAKIKSKCREYLNGEIIREYENGDFEYCFSVPENEIYWYGVILSFGNNVTILEPRSAISRILAICDEVKKIYERYGDLNEHL